MTTIKEYQQESYQQRFFYMKVLFVLALSLLGIPLSCLQLWHGNEYRNRSENNRIRLAEIKATRGRILDAERTIIADNRPSFVVSVIPEEVKDARTLMTYLSPVYPQEKMDLAGKIEYLGTATPFRAVPMWKDATWEAMAYLAANKVRIPGLVLEVNETRHYPYGVLFSHITGYIGEINSGEIEANKHYKYKPGDMIGKIGIEQQWERFLRGKDGGAQIEVDAHGREIRTLEKREPIPGHNVRLSVRTSLQEAAVAAFGPDKTGVAIAMDPRDGRILCYVSLPAYDPNRLVDGVSSEQWKLLINDPLHPLTNRGIQGQYPPGSVFKVLIAAAALQEGVVHPNDRFFCSGALRIGSRMFRCWRTHGHGTVDLHRALVESCDVYFYQVGQRLGIKKIKEWASRFGFGQPTGIELTGEKSGLVPSPEWKKKFSREPWYEGETAMVSIGQGALLVTPLQLLCMMATIANGGMRWTPRLVECAESLDGALVADNPPRLSASLPLSPSTVTVLHQALRDVVMTGSGTGTRARLQGIDVAGKTGTAQVVQLGREKGGSAVRETNDHAWFVCYAPADAPEIAVVVLVEHGGHGGQAAAPIARQILRAYFEEQHNRAPPVDTQQQALLDTLF